MSPPALYPGLAPVLQYWLPPGLLHQGEGGETEGEGLRYSSVTAATVVLTSAAATVVLVSAAPLLGSSRVVEGGSRQLLVILIPEL